MNWLLGWCFHHRFHCRIIACFVCELNWAALTFKWWYSTFRGKVVLMESLVWGDCRADRNLLFLSTALLQAKISSWCWTCCWAFMGCADMLKAAHPKFHHLSNTKCAGLSYDARAQIFVKFIRPVLIASSPLWAGQGAKKYGAFTQVMY